MITRTSHCLYIACILYITVKKCDDIYILLLNTATLICLKPDVDMLSVSYSCFVSEYIKATYSYFCLGFVSN